MKKTLQVKLTIFFILLSFWGNAQVTVNANVTANALVNNLVGQGVTTSNWVMSSAANAVGTFTATNSNLGLSSGIVLTTGRAPTTNVFGLIEQGVPIVNGVNAQTAFASSTNFNPGIPQLNNLAGGVSTFDGATLQFSFVPESSPVTFRYVFASEEYPNFAPPLSFGYNDAFAFFISGPGIVGEQNIALIPGTATPVTINNLNPVTNAQYYQTNNGNTFAYNGFTTVLTATANVIPCSTYTIKLMIADGGDSVFDSAVFLEEGSFGSAPFSAQTTTLANDNVTYEGCAPATVTFSRPVATNQPLTINYTISGTATMGVDYQNIPTSVTIPANQTSASIQIVGIEDGIPEPTETIILTFSTACGILTTETIYLMDKPPIEVDVSDGAAICNGNGPVNITATGSGGLAPLTYSWNNGGGNNASANVNPNTTTNYTVTVTDFCGSTATGQVTVNVAPVPAAPIISNNGPVCEGSNVTLSSTNVPNGTFNWTGPNGYAQTGPNQTIPNATTANAGSYSATVTVNGCTSLASTTNVVVNAAPAAPTLSSNAPICQGSTLNLTATGPIGATYNWTGPNGYTSNLQNPSIAVTNANNIGQYSVTATINGCTSPIATITPVINPQPTSPLASSDSPICGTNPLNLTASNVAGATYNWTGPNGFTSNVQNPTIANMSEDFVGDFSVTVTVNGCTSLPAVTTVGLASADPPAISYSNPICQGQTLQLSGPTYPNTTYAWTGPNGFTSTLQNPSINNVSLAAIGQYSLVINIGGCISDPANLNVLINPIPATPVATNAGPVCQGEALSLNTDPIADATYNWTGPNGFNANTQNPQVPNAPLNAGGSYNLTVTVNGCTSAAGTTNAVVNPIPAAPTLLSNSPICEGSSLDLTAANVSGATYQWNGPAAFTSNQQSPTIGNAQTNNSGSYNVVITVNGCNSLPASINTVVNAIPAAPTITSNGPVCVGANLNLSTELPGGVVVFNWSGPVGFNSSLQNPQVPSVTENNEGDYTLSITVNGCLSPTSTQNVEVIDMPPVSAGPDISFCSGSTFNLGAEGFPGVTYSWSPVTGLSDPNIPNPTVNLQNVSTQLVNYQYTVTASAGGCNLTDQVNVIVFPEPVVSFTIPSPACFENNSFNFNANGTFSNSAIYEWDFGPAASIPTSNLRNPSGINFNTTGNHDISIRVTDYGCESEVFTGTITVNPMPVANFSSDIQNGCSPMKVSFINLSETTTGPLAYLWEFGNGSVSQANAPDHVYNNPGKYNVKLTATTNQGCSDSYLISQYINVNPKAKADFRASPWELEIIEPEIELTSFSSDATDGYYLINGDTIAGFNGIYTFTEEGIYPVMHIASNEFGCNDTIVKNVIVNLGFRLYFPTVFTPNADSNNDLFRPYGEGVESYQMKIFNRWGEMIYTSFDMENGWDGTTRLSKKIVESGMYFYTSTVKDEKGKQYEFSGWVMLLR